MFDEFVIAAAALKLGYTVLAILTLVGLAWWLDARVRKMAGAAGSFAAAVKTIASHPQAAAVYYGLRLIALALVVGMLMGCATASAGVVIPDRFDRQIRAAVDVWWGDYPDWPAWKAQLYQESRLDPVAVSPVGAAGLAQFMPATWRQMQRELRLGGASPHHDIAIEAGAYYMAKLRRGWSSPRPALDRQRLAQASYNAGFGNILKAQRRCGGALLYPGIIRCLPQVTGRHSRETITYVRRIERWRRLIVAGL